MRRMNAFAARLDILTFFKHDISPAFNKQARRSYPESLSGSFMEILRTRSKSPGNMFVASLWPASYPILLAPNHSLHTVPKHSMSRVSYRRLVTYSQAITNSGPNATQGGSFCFCNWSSKFFSKNVARRSKEPDIVTESLEHEQDKEVKSNVHDSGLKIFNTMTRQKEIFKPKVTGKVSMYVCGVTVYDYSHIGHARVYVAFDVLYRYLKFLGFEVTYVRNFTDVDDKIINRARERGEDPFQLSRHFCEEFLVDMDMLQCLPPSAEPRVTEYMKQIVEMIAQILENGYGYTVEGGDVYFSVDRYLDYGRLSGRKLDENRAGERVVVDERKQNPADFALWKSAKPGEPSWDSPWGAGRPGWHIECSAMSAALLGHSFDIHGGGMDLIFPHHENEIAQSFAACKHSNVSYWMHNGFVTVDEEKMSKSLGNFFTIREVVDQYHPMAVRWFLLGTHYRSPVNYSKRQLDSATDRVYYLYQTLEDCSHSLVKEAYSKELAARNVLDCVKDLRTTFTSSMGDDLHTPVVVAALSEPLKFMNDLLHTRKGQKDVLKYNSLCLLQEEITNILEVLGLSVSSYSQMLYRSY
ncbi:hypothetical protein O6H91_09G062600 [Diphasiastrum complanatum]|uniref:Uncharacterized protein n=1 Tax=Diphasiastrum complanatum TaxID=34168 RepID=A0ACC2CQZ9_DIPCM|nr:hypothetical protein O6H91_09G062600 [Diphasiastrum complanatum]